jgi:hypothetical protein
MELRSGSFAVSFRFWFHASLLLLLLMIFLLCMMRIVVAIVLFRRQCYSWRNASLAGSTSGAGDRLGLLKIERKTLMSEPTLEESVVL